MVGLPETIHKRQADWNRLEQMIGEISARGTRGIPGKRLAEVCSLYRAACADLSMADQYRLSPEMVNYLHGLVGKAHNALYRSRRFQLQLWWDILFRQAPRQIFADRCVHICSILFFGVFTLSSYLAYNEEDYPGFAERVMGTDTMQMMEEQYEGVDFERGLGENAVAVSMYIQRNTGIGLQCFAYGPLVIPGLLTTGFNACFLGSTFGYMAREGTPGGNNFMEFVTAHGPFELTAIALAAAAGLRIGLGWLIPRNLTRLDSMQARALEAIPVMAASVMLFFLAAMTEGMISPSSLPYLAKVMWGMFSSTLLMFYFVVLGYPSGDSDAT